jgi:prepilin-type N-terminal cleavage/methylation domain-containing protein
MRSYLSGLLHKGQSGFTLVELLVAIAITGVIIIAISTAVFQVVAGNIQNSNQMTATRQVQQVGHWISEDGQMATTASSADDPETTNFIEKLTLTWTEYTSWKSEPLDEVDEVISMIINHKVIYTLSGGVLERNEWRTEEIREDVFDPEDYLHFSTTRIAQFISSIECTLSAKTIVVDVTATVEGFRTATENRVYEINMRPD